jgi:hypothetical protein
LAGIRFLTAAPAAQAFEFVTFKEQTNWTEPTSTMFHSPKTAAPTGHKAFKMNSFRG